jgi:hypothetical protein
LSKQKKSKPEPANKAKQEWNHSASKVEANALRAMMQKNAKSFKKKMDDNAKNEQEDL